MASRSRIWLGRRPILGPLLKRGRRRRRIRRWVADGRPLPPVSAFKQQLVLDSARRHRLRVLVETGTWQGDMVEAALHAFARIVSIELSPQLAERARQRFCGCDRVEILQGDSGALLGPVLQTLNRPALFWLDAHASGGDTARGEQASPLRTELELVLRHPESGHVILIDDARLLTGRDGYPTVAEIEALVAQHRPRATSRIQDDVVRIAPMVIRTP